MAMWAQTQEAILCQLVFCWVCLTSLILGEKPGLPTSLPARLQYELCPRHHLQKIWKADPAAARDGWQILMRLSQAFPGSTVSHFLAGCRRLDCAAAASLCLMYPELLKTRSLALSDMSFCSPLHRSIHLCVTAASADCMACLPVLVTPLSPCRRWIDPKSAF